MFAMGETAFPSGLSAQSSLTLVFEEPRDPNVDPRFTPTQQQAFRIDLECELARVLDWFRRWAWLPDCVPDLSVIVSPRFHISRALGPAWRGRRGRMEFPARRVASGNAAVAHELTHVCFPNANRFLAEGLAVHVQAEIGGNPAFPNFGEPLHQLARRVFRGIEAASGGNLGNQMPVYLAELDTIATPAPLTLQIGEAFYDDGPEGQRRLYPLAGSFVSFLIQSSGIAKFRELYQKTPFKPRKADPGALDRWTSVYGESLTELELQWRTIITGCGRGSAEVSTWEGPPCLKSIRK